MRDSYDPIMLRLGLDRVIGAAERILRQRGTPLQRGRAFLARLSADDVIAVLGHEHPFIVEAREEFEDAGGEGDQAIRAALAVLVASLSELPQTTPPEWPPSTSASPDPQLTNIGFVPWRLYVAVPLRSWCSPFARLWHLRKLARVGLLIVAAGLLGIAGFTLGWLPALGTVAAGLVVAVAAAAILPRREPPGTAL